MKKRITDNTCCHDFEINQIVKVDSIDNGGTYKSNGWYFDNDDCEDFDDYKPGDKIKVAEDTYHHGQTGNLVTIKSLAPGYCTDGSRSYMTKEVMFIPERDFDCYEGETYVNKQEEPISEDSETKPQTATVVEQQTAHLHPDDEVTIIRQHEDGDYLCEWRSGIRVWMRPDQLEFD